MVIFLRKVFYKLKLDRINFYWNRIASEIVRRFGKPLNIMTSTETIEYIINNKCSIARYGDGEFFYMTACRSIGFQRFDKQLQIKLKQVLNSTNPNLLLCLSNRLAIVDNAERKKLSEYWQESLKQNLYSWTRLLSKKRIYGDANLSRLTSTSGLEDTLDFVAHIKKCWENRNVIMVEGDKTRFGVGNVLFDGVKTLRRILGPSESAFDYYEQLLSECLLVSKNIEDPLVIIALGPTATVLASDLANNNVQALDIGHLDICYEKLIRGYNGAVPGKYTNESKGGDIVAECNDSEYLSQIVAKIGLT